MSCSIRSPYTHHGMPIGGSAGGVVHRLKRKRTPADDEIASPVASISFLHILKHAVPSLCRPVHLLSHHVLPKSTFSSHSLVLMPCALPSLSCPEPWSFLHLILFRRHYTTFRPARLNKSSHLLPSRKTSAGIFILSVLIGRRPQRLESQRTGFHCAFPRPCPPPPTQPSPLHHPDLTM
jgi:hypothetical protein